METVAVAILAILIVVGVIMVPFWVAAWREHRRGFDPGSHDSRFWPTHWWKDGRASRLLRGRRK